MIEIALCSRKYASAPGSSVTFAPGARAAWHTHPPAQTLIVTAGGAWVQGEGGPVEEIRSGDVIWFPPGERHGKSPTTALTHIAIQEQLNGEMVDRRIGSANLTHQDFADAKQYPEMFATVLDL